MAWLFRGLRPFSRAGVIRDTLAGFSLAAMNVPQALGYARIAGAPVVTGLYTLLLPLVAFATLGSSRYMVVAADSATAALLAGGLAGRAPLGSAHYMALAGVVALLTAGGLLMARLFRLGFLADFLSQTVLVGFLTGVGFQVGFAMLGEMMGISVDSTRTLDQVAQIVHGLPRAQLATSCLAGSVVIIVLLLQKFAPRLPGPLIAVVAATAASAGLDFSARGIALIQTIPAGLPSFGLPRVAWREIPPLLPLVGGCLLTILAQSAATARAYATRRHETLDENADLVGLSAANAVAALSGAFVVNGSPTQTAMVDRAGGRSQVTHVTTAAIVTLLLLFLTRPLRFLPQCVLGAVVFSKPSATDVRRGH
jgi:MFS superfamily sulfate permease-like transporter